MSGLVGLGALTMVLFCVSLYNVLVARSLAPEDPTAYVFTVFYLPVVFLSHS